jgi:PKD repeat protein
MKKKFLLSMIVIITILSSSCKKDTPAPTAEIYAVVSNYTITFNPSVTNTNTYAWAFGDNSTSTEANPVHTYAVSGTYTVTLTVTGKGGEAIATKNFTIAASISEMLSGGLTAANGKTWVVSTAYHAGDDGLGAVSNDLAILMPDVDNVLTVYGLGAEYDNEYTFYSDGKYKINPVNGNILAGAVYGYANGIVVGDAAWDIGMCAATYTAPSDATWSLDSADFVVDAITNPNETNVPPVHGNVTFTGKKWISLSEGACCGILDFHSTKLFIKDISATKINIALFLCAYPYSDEYITLPTHLIHLTLVPKTK